MTSAQFNLPTCLKIPVIYEQTGHNFQCCSMFLLLQNAFDHDKARTQGVINPRKGKKS